MNPTAWTGKPAWESGLSPLAYLAIRLNRWLYPYFGCDDCIGMIEHGCWCSYYGAVAPGTEPEWWRVWARKVLS